jgi:hypothetical protein
MTDMTDYKTNAESVIAIAIELLAEQFTIDEACEMPHLMMAVDVLSSFINPDGNGLGDVSQETRDWLHKKISGSVGTLQ